MKPRQSLLSEELIRGHCAHHPVDATFLGVHDFDDRLPDSSEAAIQARLAELNALESRLDALQPVEGVEPLEPDALSRAERADHRVVSGAIRVERWEIESTYRLTNPCYYLGEVNFGLISLLLRPFAPWPVRARAAIHRLGDVARFLRSAEERIRRVPTPWRDRALREVDGGRLLLLSPALERRFEGVEGWGDRRSEALEALAQFGRWLESLPDGECPRSGDEALGLVIREGHCAIETPHDIKLAAEARLAECQRALEDGAGEFGESDWRRAIGKLADHHPSPDDYPGRYAELWEQSRSFAERERLLSWPEFGIRYVPVPDWAREAAPFLYFLPYRSPAPFDRQQGVDAFITPIDSGSVDALRRCNDSVIKLNHVVHHGGIGHHVQNYWAARAASGIARVAATDCASRIAFLSGGTMAEGWACYATELMNESGFLTPLESFSQHHAHARMAFR